MSEEDVRKAAVHVADRWGFVFGISAFDVELGLAPRWWFRFRISQQERRIARFRRWLDSVDDAVLRSAYETWVDRAEVRCNEARDELATGRRRREFVERSRASDAATARNVKLSKRLPQP